MSSHYIQPVSFEELRACLGCLTQHSVILAGGTDILPKLRERRSRVDTYLSLCRLPELRGIQKVGNQLRIGSMTTHAQAAEHTLIRRYFLALSQACAHVGSQQIRNKGTLGGSLVNASPAGDIMPCIHLFQGSVEILGQSGLRQVPIQDFLLGPSRVCIAPGEVLTAIFLPLVEGRRSVFFKLGSRKEVTIAQISLCVSWYLNEGRRQIDQVWLGAVDEKPLRVEDTTRMLQAPADFSEQLSRQIRTIRLHRKRESKLKVTEAERCYKERAVKGVVFDCLQRMDEADRAAAEPER